MCSSEKIPNAPPPGTPDAASRPTFCARSRILLVEDHEDTARILAKVLRLFNYDVTIAPTATAALELAASAHFDVVLSDIGLPDASGHELMAKLRDHYGMKGIALSGYGMAEDMRKSLLAGFSHHLVKPVNLDHLNAMIAQLLGGERV